MATQARMHAAFVAAWKPNELHGVWANTPATRSQPCMAPIRWWIKSFAFAFSRYPCLEAMNNYILQRPTPTRTVFKKKDALAVGTLQRLQLQVGTRRQILASAYYHSVYNNMLDKSSTMSSTTISQFIAIAI